jgi:hypothetical protein
MLVAFIGFVFGFSCAVLLAISLIGAGYKFSKKVWSVGYKLSFANFAAR